MDIKDKAKEANQALTAQIKADIDAIRGQIVEHVDNSGMSKTGYCKSVGVRAQSYSRLTMRGDSNMTLGSLAQYAYPFGRIEVSIRFVPCEASEASEVQSKVGHYPR